MEERWLIIVALGCLIAIALTGCAGGDSEPDLSLERIRESGKLIVAIDPSYPPFETYDDKGQITGYDVDLASEVASRLGVRPDFVAIDMGGIIDALIAKKVDVIISSLTPYPEYGKDIAYSRAYFDAGQVIVIRRGSTAITALDDLKDKIVAVESGSGGELEMSRHVKSLQGMTMKPTMTPQQALNEVEEGRADAAVVDAISALEYARTHEALEIETTITDEPFVIAARRKDKALLKEIDRVLTEMAAEGDLDNLREKWL